MGARLNDVCFDPIQRQQQKNDALPNKMRKGTELSVQTPLEGSCYPFYLHFPSWRPTPVLTPPPPPSGGSPEKLRHINDEQVQAPC